MEKYLQKEEELIKQTEYFFSKSKKVYTSWYSVIDGEIYEHSRLINAMLNHPDFLIFERYDDEYNPTLVTIYYDVKLNVIPFLNFNSWKLYQNTSAYGKRKHFLLEDPIGVKKSVALSEYFPSVPGYLRNFTEYDSLSEFNISPNNTSPLSAKGKK